MRHIVKIEYEDMPSEVQCIATPDSVSIAEFKSEIKRKLITGKKNSIIFVV